MKSNRASANATKVKDRRTSSDIQSKIGATNLIQVCTVIFYSDDDRGNNVVVLSIDFRDTWENSRNP